MKGETTVNKISVKNSISWTKKRKILKAVNFAAGFMGASSIAVSFPLIMLGTQWWKVLLFVAVSIIPALICELVEYLNK